MSLITTIACLSGCTLLSTISTLVPFLHVSFLSPGRFGSCACRGRFRFLHGRLVQALPSSPSSAGLGPFPSASAFSFSLPFRGSPAPGQVCWCWCPFSLSVFFCVPLFASWLSNFHFTFMFRSFSLSFHLPRCCGACVCVPSVKM